MQNWIFQKGKIKGDMGEVDLVSEDDANENEDLVFQNIQVPQSITGRFNIYEVDPDFGEYLEKELNKRAEIYAPESQAGWINEVFDKYRIEKLHCIQNVALQTGVGIYEDVGPGSVSRITAGTKPTPNASTFTTQQSLQEPISGLNFPRIGSWAKSNITNGYRWSFTFRRPSVSFGGTTITEMGVQVVQGTNAALLNRVWAPNSGLPHVLSTTQDTLCIVEIDKVYS